MNSTTRARGEPAAAAGPGPGKRTLVEQAAPGPTSGSARSQGSGDARTASSRDADRAPPSGDLLERVFGRRDRPPDRAHDQPDSGAVVEFVAGDEPHTIWIAADDDRDTVMMASTPMTVEERLDCIERALERNCEPHHPNLARQRELLATARAKQRAVEQCVHDSREGTSPQESLAAAQGALAAAVKELMDFIIKLYGNEHRNVDIDPDRDARQHQIFPDDAPIIEEFRRSYNRLQSWKLCFADGGSAQFTAIVGTRLEMLPKELKARTAAFKSQFRSLDNADAAGIRDAYEVDIRRMCAEIDGYCDRLAEEFKASTQKAEFRDRSASQITEIVHERETNVWRELWRDAMLQVNLVLDRTWPPCRHELVQHYGPKIGNLSYIGSTAKGFKGPPKQGIRFDPEDFDVDANLDAPPIAADLVARQIRPDRGRYFMRAVGLNVIPVLGNFVGKAHEELKQIGAADDRDPFDVVVLTSELPDQMKERQIKARVWALREQLHGDPERYQRFIAELTPYLTERKELREGMSLLELLRVERIIDDALGEPKKANL